MLIYSNLPRRLIKAIDAFHHTQSNSNLPCFLRETEFVKRINGVIDFSMEERREGKCRLWLGQGSKVRTVTISTKSVWAFVEAKVLFNDA